MSDFKKIEEKLENLENRLNSIIELLSPNTNSTFVYSSDFFYDDFFEIQNNLHKADKERAERNRLLIDFRNEAKIKYSNFLSIPKEKQDYLDELIFNSVYTIHITESLMELLNLYKESFYRLMSGNISRKEFIAILNNFKKDKPIYWDRVMFDTILDKPLIDDEDDFYKILKEKKEENKLEFIKYINK